METTFIARAPVRVDFAGGGSDAPPFSVEYGGVVVNAAIRRYIHARLDVLPPESTVIIRSDDFGEMLEYPSVDAMPFDGRLDLLKGIARHVKPPWGFRLSVSSDVPPGSGLGSSGAVGVAVLGAFDAAMGVVRPPMETALLANRIERVDLGYAGGCQDSFPPATGGLGLVTMLKGGAVTRRPLDVATPTLLELERRLVLVYTGKVHLSGGIHDDIRRSYSLPDSPTIDAMRNLARIAGEMAVALERADLDRFGALMDENWVHHRRLHPSCESDVLRATFEAARPFILGGKTCGAGGGGCVVFLARDGARRNLEDALLSGGGQLIPLQFDGRGLVTGNPRRGPS